MPASPEEAAVRGAVVTGGLAVLFSQAAFGVVYGLGARDAGLSLIEALAMSAIVYAGAAQFAALGLLMAGVPWVSILVVTALLNARHALYSASLAPWFSSFPRRVRAIAAHPLTDEAYALTLPAFQRLGRADLPSYAIAAALTLPAWVLATLAGYLGGEVMPDPRVLGLDIVFPAVMGGLAVASITGRQALVAAGSGALFGVGVALLAGTTAGVLAGGIVGPLVGMALPAGRSGPGGVPEAAFVPPADGMPG
jgi:4-azaleucine resistance transporter AzlC